MKWVTSESVAAAELAAAQFIAQQLMQAMHERGRATFAISGGRTPWSMLGTLAAQEVNWGAVHLLQVDERIVPLEHEARNWRQFLSTPLAARVPQPNQHAMPVEIEDGAAAAAQYADTLTTCSGEPPTLDVVHLGLGADGHTASLFAGDSALQETHRTVALTRRYEGYPRLTVTLPVLNRARCVVWFALGAERRAILTSLRHADSTIPASRVRRDRATAFTDREAAPDV
jgi:6-phosphogluconolactonase